MCQIGHQTPLLSVYLAFYFASEQLELCGLTTGCNDVLFVYIFTVALVVSYQVLIRAVVNVRNIRL